MSIWRFFRENILFTGRNVLYLFRTQKWISSLWHTIFIYISNLFGINIHIDKITKKANSTLGFLRRNLRISNTSVKSNAYTSLVRPHLEYCSSVWSPYTKTLTNKVEMVQRRAARYATNRYHNTSSVTTMLDQLDWETLEDRRTKAQLTMFYRITNDLVDIPADQYLSPANTTTRSSHSRKYQPPTTSPSYYRNSLFSKTVISWNHLPASIAEASTTFILIGLGPQL